MSIDSINHIFRREMYTSLFKSYSKVKTKEGPLQSKWQLSIQGELNSDICIIVISVDKECQKRFKFLSFFSKSYHGKDSATFQLITISLENYILIKYQFVFQKIYGSIFCTEYT